VRLASALDARLTTMQTKDGTVVATDERKTVDLCGEQRGCDRCVRERGHEGHHETPRWDREEPVRWE
jgi:hypothetical protein